MGENLPFSGRKSPTEWYNSTMFQRWLTERIHELLGHFPVLFLQGARQVGKTTLAQQLIAEGVLNHYLTLDDPLVLATAKENPIGFVANLPERTVLDEVQRAPEILPVLKQRIDQQRTLGAFLLTGSANPLTLPRVSESLAGRMAIATLYPLSQGEIEAHRENWLRAAFAGEWKATMTPTPVFPFERIVRGGYPRVVLQDDEGSRAEWFRAYLATLLSRDLREIANIERVVELPRLLQLLAALSGRLLNIASLSREMGIPQTTLHRYLALLETLFLVVRVPAWYANLGKRLLKTPKLLLNDSGLCAYLLHADAGRLEQDPLLRGQVLETFVGMELLKQISFTGARVNLYHLRTEKGIEVDFVLEDAQGWLVAVEVKSSHTVGSDDFRGLKAFHQMVGERLRTGVLLYLGPHTLPFGEKLWAQPISALWTV